MCAWCVHADTRDVRVMASVLRSDVRVMCVTRLIVSLRHLGAVRFESHDERVGEDEHDHQLLERLRVGEPFDRTHLLVG